MQSRGFPNSGTISRTIAKFTVQMSSMKIYLRKMDAPDKILNEITRKQIIWYGHVERMDRTRLPKL